VQGHDCSVCSLAAGVKHIVHMTVNSR